MQLVYNRDAQRQSVNLTANSELVRRVREGKGNLSALLEKSMITFLEEKELREWKEASRESFESYNKMIEANGLISDDLGLL